MFRSLFVKTDVTAVRIWKHFLFASVGGSVNVYDLHSEAPLLKKEFFEGQKIYGFVPNFDGTKVIIYGGKHIALVHNDDEFNKLEIITAKILSDWILDVKWMENYTKIITVHMHNKITIWSENIISEISVKCEERCILYSAHICFDRYKEVVIFSGTVFSDVLLWKPYYRNQAGLSPVLKRLKQHKGVIFSLHCDLDQGLISSASDDRSAILWKVNSKELLKNLNPTNSDQLEVSVNCQVHGHTSRVFRCSIVADAFVTAGEDSLLIIWSFEGKMLQKIDTHQGGPIWSVDYDLNKNVICTGGNDGGISLFKVKPNVFKDTLYLPNEEVPRVIGVLQNGNMVCLSEEAVLYYYHKASKHWEDIARSFDLKSYAIMEISPCKKMVALAGFTGQIYIYYNRNNKLREVYTHYLKSKTRIFSFHWLTCKTFLVCQNDGNLTLGFLYKNNVNIIQTFILPPSKERWSTCATLMHNHIIVGDRKGNIYNFKLGTQNVLNSIKKSHSHLGVTKLYTNNDTIISLGKDGLLKKYKLPNGHLECIDSNKTKCSWLVALENNLLLSFSGDSFVISESRLQRVLHETHCGGGHRSWDYFNNLETFIFCFIQHKVLNVLELWLEDIVPRNLTSGYHVHEINCLKTLSFDDTQFLISGGEDTLLRISALKPGSDLQVLESYKVHLSSIRSIFLYRLTKTTYYNEFEYLLFSAGGRAQIILWHFYIDRKDSGIVSINCSEKYNFYEPLCQDKVETRIMDLSVCETKEQTILFAGCSDGAIKMFSITDKMELKYIKSIFYAFHSIIKIANISLMDRPLLISMSTNGYITFWDVLQIVSCNKCSSPVSSYQIHKSGINSFSYKILNNNLIFLSGGDDNSVILTLFNVFEVDNKLSISKITSFEDIEIHCAQITGVHLKDEYFISSSIDQKIVIWKWANEEGNVAFHVLQNYVTTVADPQGLECFIKNCAINVFIYGIGIEHLIITPLIDLNC